MRHLTLAAGLAVAALLPAATAPATETDTAPGRIDGLQPRVLLITSAELAEAWQPFADWKTRLGKPTVIVSLDTIAKEYEGADLQDKMKACITKHRTELGTKWVILGGDSSKGTVPDRDTFHPMSRRMFYKDIPTDVWFISDKTWNADGDEHYGLWQKDAADIGYTNAQRCVIGRIPVNTAEQVQDYTDKVIAYESNYPTTTFATSFLYTCAVPQANYKSDLVWDRYLQPKWTQGSMDRFFVNKTPWDGEVPGDFNLSPQNVAAKFNAKGHGKMHLHGHGLPHCWVMEGHKLVDHQIVETLRNDGAYPVITTVSCHTGRFDSPKVDPCITESMLRAKQAGAILAVTCAREGVPIFTETRRDPKDGKTQDYTTRLLTHFWINGLSKNMTAGEALYAVKEAFEAQGVKHAGVHWVCSEINLLGDPTLDLRANVPFTPEVEAPAQVSVGKASVAVNTGKPGLTVCLWKGDECYQVAQTGEEGTAVIAVETKSAGDLKLAVTGPSANAYLGSIAVK